MKTTLIGLFAGVLVLAFFVGWAFPVNAADNGSQKVSLYHVTGGSSDIVTSEMYSGHVTVVTPKGKNSVLINGVIQGLLPEKEYFMWVRNLGESYDGSQLYAYTPLGYYKVAKFMTDEFGNGDFHYKINKMDLEPKEYTLQVAINAEDSGTPNIGHTVAATSNDIMVVVGE